MRKLIVFNFMTLNGFYKGPQEDIGWHRHGEEENAFAAANLESNATLLFGRVTYEMMSGYWPTPIAMKNDPVVAEGMNKADKIVFSRTLKTAEWNNTRLISGNIEAEISKMKQMPGSDLVLLGSGSIAAQFAELGMIDEYQIMVDPVLVGNGKPIFNSISTKIDLKLIAAQTFKSGVVLLSYLPMTE
jgi:dihydrofolate reductase